MAQVVECLLSKALHSNPTTIKTKQKGKVHLEGKKKYPKNE
jgi:hypothetical protein